MKIKIPYEVQNDPLPGENLCKYGGMELKLVTVPEALPAKVYTTDRVGISKATHDAHLTLYKGYANKTNEIRKALSAMDIDPGYRRPDLQPDASPQGELCVRLRWLHQPQRLLRHNRWTGGTQRATSPH